MSLLYLIVALTIAWYCGSWLTAAFWFLPVRELAEALTPINLWGQLWGQGLGPIVSWLIWTTVLYVVFKTLGFATILAAPQRYTTTRPMRAIQGLLAEGLLLVAFASLVVLVLVWSGHWTTLVATQLNTEASAPAPETAILQSPTEQLMYRPWRFLLLALRYMGGIAFPVGAVLYVVAGAATKRLILRMMTPLRRVRLLGRLGEGGSAAFAGLIAEWELRYRERTP